MDKLEVGLPPETVTHLRVLDVGSGPEDKTAKWLFPESDVMRLDADPDVHPDLLGTLTSIPEPDESYDRVLAAHVLEHLPYQQVKFALDECVRVLRHGGELHIFVPSLEWACRQVLSEYPSPIVIPTLYGMQTNEWQYHKSAFTLLSLRQMVTQAGLRVVTAGRAHYTVRMTVRQGGEPQDYQAEQHYVVGVKP